MEGQVYGRVAAKQADVEAYLQEVAADPARVRRLCGWAWLLGALAQFPGDALAAAPSLAATFRPNWY